MDRLLGTVGRAALFALVMAGALLGTRVALRWTVDVLVGSGRISASTFVVGMLALAGLIVVAAAAVTTALRRRRAAGGTGGHR
jgi:hypothetical protein